MITEHTLYWLALRDITSTNNDRNYFISSDLDETIKQYQTFFGKQFIHPGNNWTENEMAAIIIPIQCERFFDNQYESSVRDLIGLVKVSVEDKNEFTDPKIESIYANLAMAYGDAMFKYMEKVRFYIYKLYEKEIKAGHKSEKTL